MLTHLYQMRLYSSLYSQAIHFLKQFFFFFSYVVVLLIAIIIIFTYSLFIFAITRSFFPFFSLATILTNNSLILIMWFYCPEYPIIPQLPLDNPNSGWQGNLITIPNAPPGVIIRVVVVALVRVLPDIAIEHPVDCHQVGVRWASSEIALSTDVTHVAPRRTTMPLTPPTFEFLSYIFCQKGGAPPPPPPLPLFPALAKSPC